MDGTDGLKRGDEVKDTGHQITMPVGKEALGRIMNVTGDPIDEQGEIKAQSVIHSEKPLSLQTLILIVRS